MLKNYSAAKLRQIAKIGDDIILVKDKYAE